MSPDLSAVPELLDALVARARAVAAEETGSALYQVYVEDGFGTGNGGHKAALLVGVEMPDSPDASSAETTQDYPHAGTTTRDESGYVTCLVHVVNGNGDQRAARQRAYAIAGGITELINTDPALGCEHLLYAVVGGRTRLNQGQDDRGAVALLTFRIQFEARL